MKLMAGRMRHSAEDIVRKLRRADELAAGGKTGEAQLLEFLGGVGVHAAVGAIAAELGVSAAKLYNWRRQRGWRAP